MLFQGGCSGWDIVPSGRCAHWLACRQSGKGSVANDRVQLIRENASPILSDEQFVFCRFGYIVLMKSTDKCDKLVQILELIKWCLTDPQASKLVAE